MSECLVGLLKFILKTRETTITIGRLSIVDFATQLTVYFCHVSSYLEVLADEMEGNMEVISTEDALNKVDSYNAMVDEANKAEKVEVGAKTLEEKVENSDQPEVEEFDTDEEEFLSEEELKESHQFAEKQSEEVLIIGSDCCQMYPSLDAIETSKLVYQAAIESKVKFDGLDYREVATYIALNINLTEARQAKIAHLIPQRRHRKGQKPKITGKSSYGSTSKHEEHWIFPDKTPTKMEEKRLFAKALEIATLTLFQTHLYQFNGIIFKQKHGGPIGLRASAAAARIVMGMFDRKLKKVCKEENIRIQTSFRYVDDIRLIMRSIRKGWRWEDGRMKYRKIWELEEKEAGVSEEQKTASVMLQIMDGIFPFLKFEMETPIFQWKITNVGFSMLVGGWES